MKSTINTLSRNSNSLASMPNRENSEIVASASPCPCSNVVPAQRESMQRKFHVMTRESARKRFPSLDERQREFAAAFPGEESKQLYSGFFVLKDDLVGDVALPSCHATLVNLPTYLGPYFEKLVNSRPEVADLDALDLKSKETVLIWSVRGEDEVLHSVAVTQAFIFHQRGTAGQVSCSFRRIIFCCGDSIAFCDYELDEEIIRRVHAAAATSTRTNYWHCSSNVQALLNERADTAGSAQPWLGKPWQYDDKGVLTHIAYAEPKCDSLLARESGYAQDYFFRDDYGNCLVRPVKPSVDVHIVDRNEATQLLPELGDLQHRLSLARITSDVRTPTSAMLVMEGAEHDYSSMPTTDPLLIANVPEYLAPLLRKLATTTPVPVSLPSLDLKSCVALLMWRLHDDDGRLHIIAVHHGIQPLLTSRPSRYSGMRFARTAFCCANQVALSGHWFDDTDYEEACGAQETATLSYSQYENAIGAIRASAAGSPLPWFGKPWCDENGTTLTHLPLFTCYAGVQVDAYDVPHHDIEDIGR